ncbi:MAG: hypothetical protein CL912_20225 [Deltaproteobacteria bacterium]|nr:hypothetical protein [Deltaproteobacteria bacterium]
MVTYLGNDRHHGCDVSSTRIDKTIRTIKSGSNIDIGHDKINEWWASLSADIVGGTFEDSSVRVQNLADLDGPVVLDVPRSDVALNDYVSLALLRRRQPR